ncbi:RNA-binding domain-containing protein [Candidatus Altiarchaeota archaeon]
MKRIHNVQVDLYSGEGERAENMRLLENFLPEDAELVEEIVEPELEGGVFTKKLSVLSARIDSSKKSDDFLQNISENLAAEDKEAITASLSKNIDDEGILYIRLDRKAAKEGQFKIIDSGDCIHIKAKIAAYPQKKEKALSIVKEMLK